MADVTKDQVIEYLEGLNIVQLNALVKELEDKWDVKAGGGAVVMAGPADAGAAAAAEPTEFDVILTEIGGKKIQVIKEVRAITSLGLKEAKGLVDGVPSPVKEAVEKGEAESIKERLEGVGASVEIKPAG